MHQTMNGPVAQLVAVGVIALVALFPSPQDLRETVAPTQTAPKVLPAEAEVAAVRVALPAAPDAIVRTPYPLGCVIDGSEPTDLSPLTGCLFELQGFIEARTYDLAVLSQSQRTLDATTYADAEVEEARRAIAMICRSKWSIGQLNDAPAEAVCSQFQ